MMGPWDVAASTLAYRTNGAERVPLAKRLDRMKFYHMHYAASGSDGRFYSEILIAVDTCHCIAPSAWIRQAALVIGGWPMQFVMGVCPTEAWTLRNVTLADWERRATYRRTGPIEALFLSDGPPIPDWPQPARLDDLQSGERLAAKVENRREHYGFRFPAAD